MSLIDTAKAMQLVRPGGTDRTAWFRIPMVSIEVCIPSRDGCDEEVLGRVFAACDYATKRGVDCEPVSIKDRYSVAACRNRGVAGFLARKKTHLLFVDDDVLLPANAVEVLAKATERLGGIICGCVPSIRIDANGRVAPYVQVKRQGQEWETAWPNAEMEIVACGGGCMMIQRDVFEAVGFPWFRWPERYEPGVGVRATTDDTDFCTRAIAKCFTITALPIRCGHKKTLDVAMLIRDAA